MEFYDPKVLKEIGSAIGPVLKVDVNMLTEARGKDAHFCVQIDLSKPMITTILIGRMTQPVSYESIGALC